MRKISLHRIFLYLFLVFLTKYSFAIEVTMQLKWYPSWQFAGYYMAQKKGYFEEAGFKVNLKHIEKIPDKFYKDRINWYFKAIDDGNVDFAVVDTSFLFYHFQHTPKVLASFIQHNPMAFFVRKNSGIKSVKDFINKRVQMFSSQSLILLLKKEGVYKKLSFVNEKGAINAFVNNKVDVASSYITSAGFFLEKTNIRYNIITPAHYGYDLYGDTLVLLNKDIPTTDVYAFREACIKGWEYAIRNPEEVIDFIVKNYPNQVDIFYKASTSIHAEYKNPQKFFHDYSLYESRILTSLFSYPIIKLGESNPGRWNDILNMYKSVGMLKNDINIDNILWNYKSVEKDIWIKRISIILTAATTIVLLLFLWNILLKKKVEKKVYIILKQEEEKHLLEKKLLQAQKMEMIGTLAGGIVHDINNALNGITGPISIIKHKLNVDGSINKMNVLNNITKMEASLDHVMEIANSLLDFSKSNEVKNFNINLKNAIEKNLLICKGMFDKSVIVNTFFEVDNPVIIGDKTQIDQCLLNIFVNANHAMTIMREDNEEKGGILDIKLNYVDKPKLKNIVIKDHGFYEISIKDHGVGIDPEIIDNIFDPFFTTKSHTIGTGLGLAMVKNIVHRNKGFIEVNSEKGVFTEFKIYFPKK